MAVAPAPTGRRAGFGKVLARCVAVARSDGGGGAFAQTMAAQATVVLLNVATGVLVARLLGADGRGAFAAITLWPQLLASVALLGLPFAQMYHARAAASGAGAALGASLLLGAGLGLAGAAIGFAVVPLLMAGGGYDPAVVAFAQAASAVTLVNLVSMLAKAGFTAVGRTGTFNLANLADPALYLALLLLVVACAPGGLTAGLAAGCMFLAGGIALAWTLARLRALPEGLRPRLRGAPTRALLRPVAGYALRGAGAGVLAAVALHLDRLALVALVSPHEFGLYAVAFSLSRLVMVVHTAVGAVSLPAMAGRAARAPAPRGALAAKALHDRTFRLVLLAGVAAVAGAAALGGPALSLLYGAEFGAARSLLAALTAEAALSCLGTVTAGLFLALGRPGYTSAAQAAGFCATAAAMLLLVPSYGAMGAAFAVAAGAAVRLAALLAGLRPLLGFGTPRFGRLPRDLMAQARGLARARA